MAQHNQQSVTLTQAQLALIAAAVGAGGAFAGSVTGFSDAQATAWYNNASRTIPNPIPQGQVAPSSISAASIESLLSQAALSAAAGIEPEISNLINIITAQGAGAGTIPFAEANVILSKLVTAGLITSAQASALTSIPDPSWVATRAASAPIDVILGSDGWAVTVTGGAVS